jgi:hypothetical protein
MVSVHVTFLLVAPATVAWKLAVVVTSTGAVPPTCATVTAVEDSVTGKIVPPIVILPLLELPPVLGSTVKVVLPLPVVPAVMCSQD